MDEQPFELPVDGGALHGHRGGSGLPALLLHGGAAVPDYTEGCAELLDGLFSTIRYTQRGTPPSGGGPPYTVEAHMADALAVLDSFGLERAWAIGHSWGGHLALHLLVAHPERLLGVLCIDALSADPSVFAAYEESLHRALRPEQSARIREIEARRRAGGVTEAELLERLALSWPHYFARRTLRRGLPAARLPALFVHGEEDPMPLGDTATLIPGARLETIPECGHFPWVEQPEAFRAAVERLVH